MGRPSPRYLAQVKAFLSYIEEVEVDEEIIEDILTGLEEEFDPSVTSDGNNPTLSPALREETGRTMNQVKMETSSLKKVWFTAALFGFSRVSFGRLMCLAKDAWTEEEVKKIIQYLKQRGKWHAVTHLI
jgi:hypothetical protein